MNVPPLFQPFIDETRSAFRYLVDKYNFVLRGERVAGLEAWMIYETQTTRVTIHYELGAEPWVEIGRLEQGDGKTLQSSSVGLELVARERGRRLHDQVLVPRDISGSEIAQMVRARAELLRIVADDLLRGDFGAYPQMERKAAKEMSDRERALFGDDVGKPS